jgi:signal peptidase II
MEAALIFQSGSAWHPGNDKMWGAKQVKAQALKKPFSNYLRDYLFLLAVAGGSVLLDQVTKWLVRTNLSFTEAWMPLDWLAPYVRIVHWKNTGAAFGLFRDGNLLFAILAIVVSLAIINYYPMLPRGAQFLRFALALQMGGAMGNLIDRITRGWVTDFVSVGALPVFNVADASITLGVVILLLPYLPELFGEINGSGLMRSAGALNRNRRQVEILQPEVEEPISLGLLEVLFAENPVIQRFMLQQKIRALRGRAFNRLGGSSR